ncbi:hypothetical protein [Clostridium tarantellae]|uniref:Uncharacterized protein n=1 Tax=Clostridium tarantellae TaxID=39493 RepID=A0A6I1MW43_9CLOT|nr:hypothetical protein [Clostridium tarantellae]
MAKKTSRNNDFLSRYRSSTSPKIYSLLLDLVNDNREDLAKEVIKVDYLIDYFNNCIKKRDFKEGKETLNKIKERIQVLKKENVDIAHLEHLYNHILKINKVKSL